MAHGTNYEHRDTQTVVDTIRLKPSPITKQHNSSRASGRGQANLSTTNYHRAFSLLLTRGDDELWLRVPGKSQFGVPAYTQLNDTCIMS